jgi:hypothetical protein
VSCVHRDVSQDLLNAFCWIHSTYTIPSAFFKKVGVDVPFPGVDHSNKYVPEDKKFTKYYQWVGFALIIQVNEDTALLFLLPEVLIGRKAIMIHIFYIILIRPTTQILDT